MQVALKYDLLGHADLFVCLPREGVRRSRFFKLTGVTRKVCNWLAWGWESYPSPSTPLYLKFMPGTRYHYHRVRQDLSDHSVHVLPECVSHHPGPSIWFSKHMFHSQIWLRMMSIHPPYFPPRETVSWHSPDSRKSSSGERCLVLLNPGFCKCHEPQNFPVVSVNL